MACPVPNRFGSWFSGLIRPFIALIGTPFVHRERDGDSFGCPLRPRSATTI